MNEEPTAGQGQDSDSGEMTVEVAWNMGKALADWLPTLGSVVIVSADENGMTNAVVEGLRLQGRTVIVQIPGDVGAASARIVADKLSGGVVVGPNGVVFLDSNGSQIQGDALADVQILIAAGNFIPADTKGELIR